MTDLKRTELFIVDVAHEYASARARYQPFHSAHEGYAVLLEEVDELWEWVRRKSADRDQGAMWRECVQIAAMALAFATEVSTASGEV